MKKFLKIFFSILFSSIIVLILYFNYKLYYQPTFSSQGGINNDVVKQLQYLKTSMHNNGAQHMQEYFPEGFLFSNAIYALSWAELANALDDSSYLYKQAMEEIDWSVKAMQSDAGRSRFESSLQLPYGAYYAGWSNYVLGKKLSAQKAAGRDSAEIKQFENECDTIAAVIATTVYPESYKNFSWPADVSVCIACLALHDKILTPKYQSVIKSWIQRAKQSVDKNGFLPYAAKTSGQAIQPERGSSQSLILNFLFEIDSSFAQQQFDLYKQYFLDHRFGLPGILEFPKGNVNTGDVDSGPVILGMGSAATVVGLRVLTLFKDSTDALAIRNGIEAFGFPSSSANEKHYIFGKLLMADIFICWSHCAEINTQTALHTNDSWRTGFQLYSLLMIAVLIFFLVLLLKKVKRKKIIAQ